MDVQIFVQNVKELCKKKGVKPTIACEESGAGKNLLNHIESRGSIPSVAKVQMLSSYLGVTVSQLLGEDASDISQGPAQPYLVYRYNHMTQEDQAKVMAFVEELSLDQGKIIPDNQQVIGHEEELVSLYRQLTPDQQALILAQLRGIVSSADK